MLEASTRCWAQREEVLRCLAPLPLFMQSRLTGECVDGYTLVADRVVFTGHRHLIAVWKSWHRLKSDRNWGSQNLLMCCVCSRIQQLFFFLNFDISERFSFTNAFHVAHRAAAKDPEETNVEVSSNFQVFPLDFSIFPTAAVKWIKCIACRIRSRQGVNCPYLLCTTAFLN